MEKEKSRALSKFRKRLLVEKGEPLFRKYGIEKVYLFGSVVDQRCCQTSDLDILVFPLSGEKYWHLRHDLEKALEIPIDLYTDTDDALFVKKIISRGSLIYEAVSRR